jgi:hypothetical protein
VDPGKPPSSDGAALPAGSAFRFASLGPLCPLALRAGPRSSLLTALPRAPTALCYRPRPATPARGPARAFCHSDVIPSGVHPLSRGYAANRSTDVKSGLTSVFGAIAGVPDFGAPTKKWFPWTRAYQRDQWLDELHSRSDHAALEPAVRDRLFEAIGAAIDDYGGSFVMNFETVLITATRLA